MRPPDAIPHPSLSSAILCTGLPGRLRLDLRDPEHHAVATAALTLARRENGAASLLSPVLVSEGDGWRDGDFCVFGGHTSTHLPVAAPRKCSELLLGGYASGASGGADAPLRARVGRHLFLCAAHRANAPLEAREAVLHAASDPHRRDLFEEIRDDGTSWSPAEVEIARESPHAVGLLVALHWSQGAAFMRAALFLQRILRRRVRRKVKVEAAHRIGHEKAAARLLEEDPERARAAPEEIVGLSPVAAAMSRDPRRRATALLTFDAAVATLTTILRQKVKTDEHAEGRRQAKMPLAQFLLKWHTMRFGAGYGADAERARLLGFVESFVDAWRKDGDVAHQPLLRHPAAPRLKQICSLMGLAPRKGHLSVLAASPIRPLSAIVSASCLRGRRRDDDDDAARDVARRSHRGSQVLAAARRAVRVGAPADLARRRTRTGSSARV